MNISQIEIKVNMKKQVLSILLLSILLVLTAATSASVNEPRKEEFTFMILSPYSYNTLDRFVTLGVSSTLKGYYQNKNINLKMVTLYLNNSINEYALDKKYLREIEKLNPKCIFITNGVLYHAVKDDLKDYKLYFINYNLEFNEKPDNYVNYIIDLDKLKRLLDTLGLCINKFYIFRNCDRRNSFNISKLYIHAIERTFPRALIEIKECKNTITLREKVKEISNDQLGIIILSFRTILNEDSEYITETEVIREMVNANKKHLELGFDELTTEGFLFSCAPTFKDIGINLASIYLNQEHNHTDIPSKLSLNYNRLKKLNNINWTISSDFYKYIDVIN